MINGRQAGKKAHSSVLLRVRLVMTKAETIEQLKKVLAALECDSEEAPKAPAIRSVKVGDLEWQADVPDREFTWQEAKDYAASLGDGWRLPTIQELLTLVDYTKHKPACSVFPDCPSEWFWSASAYSGDTASAWSVGFYVGDASLNGVGFFIRVRCVR